MNATGCAADPHPLPHDVPKLDCICIGAKLKYTGGSDEQCNAFELRSTAHRKSKSLGRNRMIAGVRRKTAPFGTARLKVIATFREYVFACKADARSNGRGSSVVRLASWILAVRCRLVDCGIVSFHDHLGDA
jgi:hypothetical protein